VIIQEFTRFNNMLKIINSSLKTLQKAVKGTVAMSAQLDAIGTSLFNNQVPKDWAKKAYPSLKPLASWLIDLEMRLTFMNKWMNEGHQPCYWVSGFFFPQGFLTATKQEITRRHKAEKWALDDVLLTTEVMEYTDIKKIKGPPEEGVYIHGLILEGCTWGPNPSKPKDKILLESIPKELFSNLPVLYVSAISTEKLGRKAKDAYKYYECPCYTKPRRTGASYVFRVKLRTDKEPDHWILRGVALLCSKD